MRGGDDAACQRQRRAHDALHVEALERERHAAHLGDRVHRAHLVEVHILRRDAMDARPRPPPGGGRSPARARVRGREAPPRRSAHGSTSSPGAAARQARPHAARCQRCPAARRAQPRARSPRPPAPRVRCGRPRRRRRRRAARRAACRRRCPRSSRGRACRVTPRPPRAGTRRARDPGRDRARPEAVVDVHDGDTGGARAQHGQERGDPAEGRAVARAGRHADHRRGGEAPDHRGQRGVLPRHDDDAVGPREVVEGRREAVQSRHARVRVDDHPGAEQLGAHARLGHHGAVGGAARDDGHEAAGRRHVARDPGEARALVLARNRAPPAAARRAPPRRRGSPARCPRRRRAARGRSPRSRPASCPRRGSPPARPGAAPGGCRRARTRGRGSRVSPSQPLRHPVDAGAQRRDVGRLHGREHTHAQLVAAERCGRARRRPPRWPAAPGTIAAASTSAAKSIVPTTSERLAGRRRTAWRRPSAPPSRTASRRTRSCGPRTSRGRRCRASTRSGRPAAAAWPRRACCTSGPCGSSPARLDATRPRHPAGRAGDLLDPLQRRRAQQGQPQPAVGGEALLGREVVDVRVGERDRHWPRPRSRRRARAHRRPGAPRGPSRPWRSHCGPSDDVHAALAARRGRGPEAASPPPVEGRSAGRSTVSLARELAVGEMERALAHDAEGGGVPEGRRATVAEGHLVAAGAPNSSARPLRTRPTTAFTAPGGGRAHDPDAAQTWRGARAAGADLAMADEAAVATTRFSGICIWPGCVPCGAGGRGRRARTTSTIPFPP